MYNETASKILENQKKQLEACKCCDVPNFVPDNGICYSCHRQVYEYDNLKFPITGCPFCHRSFCD